MNWFEIHASSEDAELAGYLALEFDEDNVDVKSLLDLALIFDDGHGLKAIEM